MPRSNSPESRESGPMTGLEFTELPVDRLDSATGLYGRNGPQFEGRGGRRLHNWSEQYIPGSRDMFRSDEEYEKSLAKTTALNTVITTYYDRKHNTQYGDGHINELVGYAKSLGIDEAEIAGTNSLREAIHQMVHAELKARADMITHAIGATGMEFWLIAQKLDNTEDHAVAARYVGVTVASINNDLKIAPVILDKTKSQKGLFPHDYRLKPIPLYTTW